MNSMEIYIDGSCTNNPGNTGSGALVIVNGDRYFYAGGSEYGTNSTAELNAFIFALQLVHKKRYRTTIYSDSEYVVNTWNEWILKWARRNFKGRKNKEIMKIILAFKQSDIEPLINVVHVAAHSGIEGNEIADTLAKEANEFNYVDWRRIKRNF